MSVLCVVSCTASELTRIQRLAQYAGQHVPQRSIEGLMKEIIHQTYKQVQSNDQPALFSCYPRLSNTISYVSLADMPTPVVQCSTFDDDLSVQLYIKHDGQTGRYQGRGRSIGGNKVRKLEFILADALAHNADTVLTFGCAGSNHAVTTAAYAQKLGLSSIAILRDQPNSSVVQRNLLFHLPYQTNLVYASTEAEMYKQALQQFELRKQQVGTYPYIIPIGGSMPLGVLGYINAVFELKQQIKQGLLPEPKVIFVAAGSGGTAAGLLIGLQITGLKSKLVAIHIEPEQKPDEMKQLILKLCTETCAWLHQKEPRFALFDHQDSLEVLTEFGGTEYGAPDKEALACAASFALKEGIALDPTYTAKALHGMCSYISSQELSGPVLFWNTFSSDPLTELMKGHEYHSLPVEFHRYFEGDDS